MNEDQMTENNQNATMNDTDKSEIKHDKTYTWDIMQEVKDRAYKKGYSRGYSRGYEKGYRKALVGIFSGYHIDIFDDKFVITKQDATDQKKSE